MDIPKNKYYLNFRFSSGLFKEPRKLLKNGDLDYLKEIDPTEYIYQFFYIWKQKEYLASELHDLTEQEKNKSSND